MTRRRYSPVLNDCGYCVLEGPDRDGQYDLVESPECPVHGFENVEEDPAEDDRESERWDGRWAA